MIDPNAIPIPKANPDEVETAGRALKTDGTEISDAGHDIHSTWQRLRGAYIAPEAEQLFAATRPVQDAGDAFKGEVTTVGDALISFAGEVRPIIGRLQSLKTQAQNFRNEIAGDDDWRKDEDKVDEHNRLNDDVLAAVAQYQEAERRCANKITGIFGGTQFVSADQRPGNGQRAYGLGEAPKGVETPWAKPQEHDKPWYQDAWDGVWDFGSDIVVGAADLVGLHGENGWVWEDDATWLGNLGGNWMNALRNTAGLVGLHGENGWVWEEDSHFWSNLGNNWKEMAHSFVPWREWDDRPGYVITQGVLNVGSVALGGAGLVRAGFKLFRRGDSGGDTDVTRGDANGDGRIDSGELGNVDQTPTTRDLQNQLNQLDFDNQDLADLQRQLDQAEDLRDHQPAPVTPDGQGDTDPGGSRDGGHQPADNGRDPLPDTGTPDADRPGDGRPDGSLPDTDRPDATAPDVDRPGDGRPDGSPPDADGPGADRPDATAPDADRPGGGRPDDSSPDVDRPGDGRPDGSLPDSDAPGADRPDATAPDVDRPGDGRPDGSLPDADGPGADRPDTDAPGTDGPGDGRPDGSLPDADAPGDGQGDTAPDTDGQNGEGQNGQGQNGQSPYSPEELQQRLENAGKLEDSLRRAGLSDEEIEGLRGDEPREGDAWQRAYSAIRQQFPGSVQDRMHADAVRWAADGAEGNPREFAHRYEYFKARFDEVRRELDAARLAGENELTKKQVPVAAADRMGDLNLTDEINADMAEVRRARPDGGVRIDPDASGDALEQAVRDNAGRIDMGSESSAAYHAHKHYKELPESERTGDMIRDYLDSAERTIREGEVWRRQTMDNGSEQLIIRRDVGGTVMEAIIYVKPDGSTVMASYGSAKVK
ncbi:hypothetical protein [Thermomonospora amylolytica]|uniref:hypothetical protein n=1 Tax=Thermomonospora amylolytica TaxID=1411117 RepID=UPI000E6C35F1|nr:hypothetical protein [Thermomonospora amylolytica]